MAENKGDIVLVCGRAPERVVHAALDDYHKVHGIGGVEARSNLASHRWSRANGIPCTVVAKPDAVITMPGYRGRVPKGVRVVPSSTGGADG